MAEAPTAGAARKGVSAGGDGNDASPEQADRGEGAPGLPDPLNQQARGPQRRGRLFPSADVAPPLATALIRASRGSRRLRRPVGDW